MNSLTNPSAESVATSAITPTPVPVFIEQPIPDVSTVAIEDIDVSNPFMFRQNKWQSYFKRLRDE